MTKTVKHHQYVYNISVVTNFSLTQLLQPNTFQVVLTSSSEVSYAIFTYQCGSLNPNAYTPSIGYSFSSSFFENHFLSEQTNASEIACLNQPSSVWSNVVYKLNLVNGELIKLSTQYIKKRIISKTCNRTSTEFHVHTQMC